MLVSNSGPDASGRAALRLLMELLPGMSIVEGASVFEPVTSTDQPTLRSATVVEGTTLRALKVPDFSRETISGFGAFLDGAQKVQVVAHRVGIPIVLGTVSAAIRIRVNRRLTTWEHQPPRVERRFYLPFRYLPELSDHAREGGQLIDTCLADRNGNYPIKHPVVLLERAFRAVDQERDKLEDGLAKAWCAVEDAPLFIDGGISRMEKVASSQCAIGVIKTHRALYAKDDALGVVFALGKGERSSVFRVESVTRSSVLSWYLRLRATEGRDPLWGLVRIEMSECDRPSERANEISRWVMAEMTPLSLPDGRWDKMAYGVRDCEEFLRAIS